jgi:hypothetical protein
MPDLFLPSHIKRQPLLRRQPAPTWASQSPEAYAKWRRLQQALGLIQQELVRVDQCAKLAALVELAFELGREAERERAKAP